MDKQECIERQLESALLEGRWGVFERLPSERGLAEAFGVNRATVRAALRALAGRGILETRRGSGTVVRALPGDARHAAGTFADYLAAFRILMPPLVAASLPAVSPSVISNWSVAPLRRSLAPQRRHEDLYPSADPLFFHIDPSIGQSAPRGRGQPRPA